MIGDLRPYSEYKDSGLPWFGQVPSHWVVSPLARVARLKTVINQSDRQLLSVYLQRGVVRFSDVAEKRTNTTSEDLGKYQAVDPGDFVLNNQQAWRGSVGVSDFSGIVSPAYLVLALSNQYLPRYANSLFRDQSMVAQYLICSKGVGTIQRNLYWPHLKRVGVIVPPPEEQAAIVRFLDWANGRLDRAIRAKRKVIALLNEQKQAIIHCAVTRGLDPSVPLKPSGIPWIGEIPAHWEVRKIKQCASRFFAGGTPDSGNERYYTDSESGIPWLVIGDISGQRRVQSSANRITDAGRASRNLELLPEGTVVLAMYASVGAAAILDSPSTVNQALIGIAPREHLISSDWLLACLEAVRPELLKQASASTQANLNAWKVRNIIIPLPLVSEQRAIVVEIDHNLGGLQTAISRLEREIALLREYRTRLVADVVTGKLDVREVATRLPDEELLADLAAAEEEPDDLVIEEEADA